MHLYELTFAFLSAMNIGSFVGLTGLCELELLRRLRLLGNGIGLLLSVWSTSFLLTAGGVSFRLSEVGLMGDVGSPSFGSRSMST